jgi:hypothetical protein
MTIWDGHGRTPHDTLENILSITAMFFCLPCLCFVACSKIKLPTFRKEKEMVNEEQPESHNDTVLSKPMAKLASTNEVAETRI